MNAKDFETQALAVFADIERPLGEECGHNHEDDGDPPFGARPAVVKIIAAALNAAYTAGTKEKRCTNFCPPTWTAHWRIWHRGHGCDLDDGVKP